jgi:hypothetical protein
MHGAERDALSCGAADGADRAGAVDGAGGACSARDSAEDDDAGGDCSSGNGRAAVGEYRLGARFLFKTEVVWLGRDSAFELCHIC